jgi:hypothetical protein
VSFANLPLLGVIAGLVGLAAVLYALQWLRVRYREVPVVTTMFWREALEEAPARVFRERFRHLPAYLLLLAICALLWLALAGPRWPTRDDNVHYVLLLDGSAAMARGDRFERAVHALEADLRRLNKDRREVIWVGGRMRTLLASGEDAALLQRRIADLAPEATPSMMDQAVRLHETAHRPHRKTEVRTYRGATAAPRANEPNAGITALGIAAAASGAWNRFDALVRAESTAGSVDLTALEITLDEAALPVAQITAVGEGAFLLKDLPAAGALLQVKIRGGDSFALDDVASVRLPRRPAIRVQVSPSLQPVLARVLAADPGVESVVQDPHVVIRRASESIGTGQPALVFAPLASQPAAFRVAWPQAWPSDRLAATMQSFGLAQIDASALAQVAQRPIGISVEPGPRREFSVWEELLRDDYNFTRSRSFPLFVAQSVRWLAATPGWYPYVAAGEPLPQGELASASIDVLGAAFVPEVAGELSVARGEAPLHAALLDSGVTVGTSGDIGVEDDPLSLGAAPDPMTLLLLLALLLLAAEWLLYQRGRVP